MNDFGSENNEILKARLKNGESLDDINWRSVATVKNACRRNVRNEVRRMRTRNNNGIWFLRCSASGRNGTASGKISEMQTGEGKTLVATLPLYLNALTGGNVHLVTVNDYLAQRDSQWMGQIFRWLGLTVGCIQNTMNPSQRREQYACDITYGTNSEFGFDYLRDNGMATDISEQVQRGQFFAIIDEVDSILIDEARTPLHHTRGPTAVSTQKYSELNRS